MVWKDLLNPGDTVEVFKGSFIFVSKRAASGSTWLTLCFAGKWLKVWCDVVIKTQRAVTMLQASYGGAGTSLKYTVTNSRVAQFEPLCIAGLFHYPHFSIIYVGSLCRLELVSGIVQQDDKECLCVRLVDGEGRSQQGFVPFDIVQGLVLGKVSAKKRIVRYIQRNDFYSNSKTIKDGIFCVRRHSLAKFKVGNNVVKGTPHINCRGRNAAKSATKSERHK